MLEGLYTSGGPRRFRLGDDSPAPLLDSPPPQPNWLGSPCVGGQFRCPWQQLNGGSQPRDLTVKKVLSLVRRVASLAVSEQENYISQGSAGRPAAWGRCLPSGTVIPNPFGGTVMAGEMTILGQCCGVPVAGVGTDQSVGGGRVRGGDGHAF